MVAAETTGVAAAGAAAIRAAGAITKATGETKATTVVVAGETTKEEITTVTVRVEVCL